MDEKTLTFKQKMNRLEEISSLLSSELELEKMVDLVDEAKKLIADLEETLEKAKSEINQ